MHCDNDNAISLSLSSISISETGLTKDNYLDSINTNVLSDPNLQH